ncbi:MAG: hypothetical protein QM594_12715 [Niabella sp.]
MKYLLSTCLLLCFAAAVSAQSKPQVISEIENLLGEEKYAEVDKMVKQRFAYFIKTENTDTLSYYITIPLINVTQSFQPLYE